MENVGGIAAYCGRTYCAAKLFYGCEALLRVLGESPHQGRLNLRIETLDAPCQWWRGRLQIERHQRVLVFRGKRWAAYRHFVEDNSEAVEITALVDHHYLDLVQGEA